ncbi:ubiquitin-specific protease ubp1 [Taxawa tesnikishii (nom. ined.)]|nr:ubiquitin-specific protease ubp1 [Dothideales sp. JES 119]
MSMQELYWNPSQANTLQWTWLATGVAVLYGLHKLLVYFDYPFLSSRELLWNLLVYALPDRLVFSMAAKQKSSDTEEDTKKITNPSTSEKHAAKSEALRELLGLNNGIPNTSPRTTSARRSSLLGGLLRKNNISDAPAGLGNWDNSCYQNSVLQGLSSLHSLTDFLNHASNTAGRSISTTTGSLRETVSKLNDPSNNGSYFWTPAKLKSMNSWQQQDAQEYFSKIMDDLDKDAIKTASATPSDPGLKDVAKLEGQLFSKTEDNAESADSAMDGTDNKTLDSMAKARNPLEGFIAQRVACTQCGFSEGLSMIPFNCLTVPLGRNYEYDIKDCLDESTNLEDITGVECAKCTLLKHKGLLESKAPKESGSANTPTDNTLSLPPEVRTMFLERLKAVELALDEDDFSDSTLFKKCQIGKNARVSSTKTRQAVVGRAPQSLVIHIQRSLFDEYTGAQMKNGAAVRYPHILDLGPWCLGTEMIVESGVKQEDWLMDARRSMVPQSHGKGAAGVHYQLRAVVTHYGRHENGHYVCYRKHPVFTSLSPEDELSREFGSSAESSTSLPAKCVTKGNVFMLFYERIDSEIPIRVGTDEEVPALAPDEVSEPVAVTPDDTSDVLPNTDAPEVVRPGNRDASPSTPVSVSTEDTTSDDKDECAPTHADQPATQARPSPVIMRTSRSGPTRKDAGYSSALRVASAF